MDKDVLPARFDARERRSRNYKLGSELLLRPSELLPPVSYQQTDVLVDELASHV